MKITPQCVVALTWTLQDTQGEVLDELDEPIEFLLGGHDLLEAIETALHGQEVGSSLQLHLEPEQAFGEYDESLVFLEPRELFAAELEEGMILDGAALPAGVSNIPPSRLYTVTDVYPEHVILDGNHPLAGFALRLQLKVVSVREASADEIEQGTLGTGFFKVESGLPPANYTLH